MVCVHVLAPLVTNSDPLIIYALSVNIDKNIDIDNYIDTNR